VRAGSDVALVAIGSMVAPARAAAELLAAEGISATVVNARFLKPLDGELLCQVAQDTPHVITVEEGCLMGGFGSAVLEMLESREIYNVRVHRMGLPDNFIEHGPRGLLLEKYGLDAAGIARRARQVLNRPPVALQPESSVA
jgi:1-deoxy-D-xylulose-5-phosphate synthase